MEEESFENRFLIRLVEDHERTWVFGFWRVVEVGNILGNDFTVGDEEPLPIDHVRNHHDLIHSGIGKLQWCLACFDIKCQNDGIGRQ
jgi:hypothetical protein